MYGLLNMGYGLRKVGQVSKGPWARGVVDDHPSSTPPAPFSSSSSAAMAASSELLYHLDLVLGMEKLGENWASVFSPIISIFLLAMDLSSAYLNQLRKKHSKSNDCLKLQEEIKLLLKEANALSGFAQSAKLKRQEAAKERELERINEVSTREERESYYFNFSAIQSFKVFIYLVSIWCFWNSPVASIAQQKLVPFGRVLSWTSGNRVFGHLKVGIIPWLMLNSRLSNLISRNASPVSK